MLIRRLAVGASVLVGSLAVTLAAFAQNGTLPVPTPGCTPNGTTHLISQNYPTGGLEPEFPIWCYPQPTAGLATAIRTANSWVDNWNNDGPAIQSLRDGDYDYRVFERPLSNPANFKFGSFINTDHWMIDMVDVSPDRLSGGVLVSPDQTFQFVNGKLVVEVDAAAGAPGMGSADHYYELDISPAETVTPWVTDALYGYGQFGGAGAVGCRLEGGFICAMYDASNRVTGGQCPPDGRVCTDNGGRPGRVWETQGVGTSRTAASVRGGFGREQLLLDGPGRVGDVYRSCPDNVHDLHCRDRFRLEITKTSINMYVNGRHAMSIEGLYAVNPFTGADNRIPDSWINGGVRFYMNSWINGGQHTPLRWHWNHVAVNPPYPASQAVSESYCAGNTVTNPNGTLSPNTCSHVHVPGQPEIGPAGPPATAVPPQPTQTPPAAPTATSTPVPAATSTPTVVPTPAALCEVFVRIAGVEQWLTRPAAFCS